MRNLSKLAAVVLAGTLAAAPTVAAERKAGVLATVNGKAIPTARAEAFIAEQKAKGTPDTPEFRDAVREELVRREVIAQEARKKGLDKNTEVAANVELAVQAVLIRAYIADYFTAHPIGDAVLKQDYDRINAQRGQTEYKIRHILVDKEEEAAAIIAKLEKGEKFEELAKDSTDPGSRDKGGDLGWNVPAAFVQQFSDAVTKLEKGKYTTAPVKTDFGYHVILVEDSRPLTPPPFEQVKPQLRQRAQQQAIDKMVADLYSKAKVE